jgi:hypothetical protein
MIGYDRLFRWTIFHYAVCGLGKGESNVAAELAQGSAMVGFAFPYSWDLRLCAGIFPSCFQDWI